MSAWGINIGKHGVPQSAGTGRRPAITVNEAGQGNFVFGTLWQFWKYFADWKFCLSKYTKLFIVFGIVLLNLWNKTSTAILRCHRQYWIPLEQEQRGAHKPSFTGNEFTQIPLVAQWQSTSDVRNGFLRLRKIYRFSSYFVQVDINVPSRLGCH